jgi:hypothetical protein
MEFIIFKYEKNCQAGFPFSAGNGKRRITALPEELRQQLSATIADL